jgi:transposase-like protein
MQDFMDRFATEESCRQYIADVRWNDSPICPKCGASTLWRIRRGVLKCRSCRRDISITAGTVFGNSRIPLRLWFQALWLVIVQKNGVSAQGLARAIGITREKTGWQLLRRIRSAMVRAGRERLSGTVEVDEVFLGGVKPGKRGRGAAGKVLILVAVEDKGKAGFGRIRISVIPDAKSETLIRAVKAMVETGSTIRTDRHASYPSITKHGYRHVAIDRESVIGEDPTPLVHRIASLLKRWLLGTHQGGVQQSHIASYLDEFVFRFNRRTSRSRGLLFRRLVENMVQNR